jgi:hypothetical protein
MKRVAAVCGVLGLALTFLPASRADKSVRPAAVALLEDDADDLIKHLNNDGTGGPGAGSREDRDVYCGACALRVTPLQRFRSRVPGWQFVVAEKPGPTEFRYLRFAWKKVGGKSIMIQLHAEGPRTWNNRYVAGKPPPPWPALKVSEDAPAEWEVVTRDLYKDFGAMTLTGIAFTPMDGTAGLFDHVMLGRTVADLDRAGAIAFGREPLKAALTAKRLQACWKALAGEAELAGEAMRILVAGSKEGVPFLRDRLKGAMAAREGEMIDKLIARLDDDDFETREDASRALEKLGARAKPALQAARKATKSAEMRKRIDQVLKAIGPAEIKLNDEQVRFARAVRVLAQTDTPAAREALKELAKTPRELNLHLDAKEALDRLSAKKP